VTGKLIGQVIEEYGNIEPEIMLILMLRCYELYYIMFNNNLVIDLVLILYPKKV